MAASSPDKTSAKDMSAKDMSAKDTSADDPSADDTARATAALDRLAALHPKLIDLGLTRTFDLLDRLGNPHHRLPPVIHVAGTNGKGSVIALMRAMAEAAGGEAAPTPAAGGAVAAVRRCG